MAFRHLLLRLSPRLDRRWLIAAVVIGVLALVASFIRWGGNGPPLQLVALGADGELQDSISIPGEWMDTSTTTPDAVVRAPLVLGVRNPGLQSAQPARLELSLPVRYRLAAPGGGELEPRIDPSSPLLSYSLRPGLGPVEPQRLPALLPAFDTLWLEVVIPEYYCVAIGDSIPEFVPAPPPPLGSLSSVRIFYSFEGGDLEDRATGVLTVGLDTTRISRVTPPDLPSYPMEADPQLAQPELAALLYGGSRRSRCGEPEDPMELLSTVWETPEGGRFIALDYGGTVRKHLYDLDGDEIIERESWDPDGDGNFEATRRIRLPIPEFLLPMDATGHYDLARLDSLPPDSLTRLDPFRGAMTGPGALPATGDSAAPAAVADAPPLPDTLPAPRIRVPQPLGRPIPLDTTGGGR